MRVSGFSLLCGMKEKFNMTEFNEILALPNCQISPVYYVPQSKCWVFLLPPLLQNFPLGKPWGPMWAVSIINW